MKIIPEDDDGVLQIIHSSNQNEQRDDEKTDLTPHHLPTLYHRERVSQASSSPRSHKIQDPTKRSSWWHHFRTIANFRIEKKTRMNMGGSCKRSAVLAALILASVTVQGEAFHSSSPKTSCGTNRKDTMCFSSKDDEQEEFEVQTWNPLRLAVLKLGLTEPAMTSPLNYGKKEGIFSCAYCGKELFDSDSKYDSGSGWPSFWRSIEDGAVNYKKEFGGGLECRCGRCTSHLGHVFLDGPKSGDVAPEILLNSPPSDPRGKFETGRLPRFCVNGASLRLNERPESNN